MDVLQYSGEKLAQLCRSVTKFCSNVDYKILSVYVCTCHRPYDL